MHRPHRPREDEPAVVLTGAQRRAIAAFEGKLASGAYALEAAACTCGSTEGRLLAQRDRFALPVETWLCRRCGGMWTSPRLTAASLARFYDEDYRAIYIGAAVAPDAFFDNQIDQGRRIEAFLRRFLPGSALTIYDVGCGAGGMLVPFRDAGHRVAGCDLGAQYLDRGRGEGLDLVHGDVAALRKRGRPDLILLSHVLEHLPEPVDELRRLADCLEEGGLLYVELPGIFNIHRTYRGDLRYFLQNAHLYHYTLHGLVRVAAAAGFELVWGDQRIRALFRRSAGERAVPVRNERLAVAAYLWLCRMSRRLPAAFDLQRLDPALGLWERARGRLSRLRLAHAGQ